MTLPEAKEQAAKRNGWESFDDYYKQGNKLDVMAMLDEAAELYAKSKWDEACETYNRALTEHYCIKKDYRIHDDRTAYFVTTAPKPEFKP